MSSKWRKPVRFIENPNRKVRMASNLMALNNILGKDPSEIQTIIDIIRSTQGSKWFKVLDLNEAFYYVENEEEHKHKTVFKFYSDIINGVEW